MSVVHILFYCLSFTVRYEMINESISISTSIFSRFYADEKTISKWKKSERWRIKHNLYVERNAKNYYLWKNPRIFFQYVVLFRFYFIFFLFVFLFSCFFFDDQRYFLNIIQTAKALYLRVFMVGYSLLCMYAYPFVATSLIVSHSFTNVLIFFR